MPQPNGYRKALRFMKHADKFGFPIVTFVDTPGAYAGKNAEELGQGEVRAIADSVAKLSSAITVMWAATELRVDSTEVRSLYPSFNGKALAYGQT